MKLAFKYRFYPTEDQAQVLARTFGCVRYVYNMASKRAIRSSWSGI